MEDCIGDHFNGEYTYLGFTLLNGEKYKTEQIFSKGFPLRKDNINIKAYNIIANNDEEFQRWLNHFYEYGEFNNLESWAKRLRVYDDGVVIIKVPTVYLSGVYEEGTNPWDCIVHLMPMIKANNYKFNEGMYLISNLVYGVIKKEKKSSPNISFNKNYSCFYDPSNLHYFPLQVEMGLRLAESMGLGDESWRTVNYCYYPTTPLSLNIIQNTAIYFKNNQVKPSQKFIHPEQGVRVWGLN